MKKYLLVVAVIAFTTPFLASAQTTAVCQPGDLFNTQTGARCATVTVSSSACPPGALFNDMTGVRCDSSTITTASTTTPLLTSCPVGISCTEVNIQGSVGLVPNLPPVIVKPTIWRADRGVIYGSGFSDVSSVYVVPYGSESSSASGKINLLFSIDMNNSTINIISQTPPGMYELYVANSSGVSLPYLTVQTYLNPPPVEAPLQSILNTQQQTTVQPTVPTVSVACQQAEQAYQTAENQLNTFEEQNPYFTESQSNPNISADLSTGRGAILGQELFGELQAYTTAEQNALEEEQVACQ